VRACGERAGGPEGGQIVVNGYISLGVCHYPYVSMRFYIFGWFLLILHCFIFKTKQKNKNKTEGSIGISGLYYSIIIIIIVLLSFLCTYLLLFRYTWITA